MTNNAEFFEALQLLVKEKGIDGEYLLEKIREKRLRRKGKYLRGDGALYR